MLIHRPSNVANYLITQVSQSLVHEPAISHRLHCALQLFTSAHAWSLKSSGIVFVSSSKSVVTVSNHRTQLNLCPARWMADALVFERYYIKTVAHCAMDFMYLVNIG